MADVKISALPAATTPLAGTEVLPIVQSNTTDQVSVANLTAGRAVSAASLTLTTTPLAAASGGTGLSALGANVATFLGTPSSANLASAVTDETGSGALVFGTSPTLATPTFTTSATGPLLIGGTGTTSTLTLRSTSGVGTTNADIIFQTGNNGATEAMRVQNTGNVAIGSTFSTNTLDIYNATSCVLGLRGDSTTNFTITRASTDASASQINIQKAAGTIASPAIVTNNDIVSRVVSNGHDGTTYRACSEIRTTIDGVPAASDMPGRLAFFTTPSGTSTVSERMRIDNAGNFALGTTTSTGARFRLAGAATLASQGTSGVRVRIDASTITNNSTAASGTVVSVYGDAFKTITFAATNASVTYTTAYGAYFEAPTAGSNITITNNWALGADSILSTGAINSNSATAGLGYATGSGGTVTQGAGSGKSTAVTLSKVCGQITMNNAALAANTTVNFTLTNTAIAATDVIVWNHQSGGTIGSYTITSAQGAGSATVYVRNVTAGSLSEAIVLSFAVIKAVTA